MVSSTSPQTPFAVRGQYKRALPASPLADEPTPALRATYGRLPALLSSDDERALCARIQRGGEDGRAARNELVVANVRLARRCAGLFIASRQHVGALTLDDLIQEALLGVMRAADRYDGRGKFSTYAVWWIRQALSRALDDQAEMIDVPNYVNTAYKKVRNRAVQLQNTGKPVTHTALVALGVTEHEIEVMQSKPQSVLSVDRAVYADGEETVFIRDLVVDPVDVMEEVTDRVSTLDMLAWAKTQFTARDWGIFVARTLPDEPTPYLTLGRRLNISHERCRQIMLHVQLKLVAKGLCPDGSIQPDGPRAKEARAEIKRQLAEQVERNRELDARKRAKRQAARQARQARTIEQQEVSG